VGRSESLQACARRVWQEVPEVAGNGAFLGIFA